MYRTRMRIKQKSQSNTHLEGKNMNIIKRERERAFIFSYICVVSTFLFCSASDNKTTINTDLNHIPSYHLQPFFLFYPSLSHKVRYREKGATLPSQFLLHQIQKQSFQFSSHHKYTSHRVALRFSSSRFIYFVLFFFVESLHCEERERERESDGEFIWVFGFRREVGVGGEGRRFG